MLFEILAFIIGLIYSAATAIGMFITVIILVIIFIIGTFIGDILEVAMKKITEKSEKLLKQLKEADAAFSCANRLIRTLNHFIFAVSYARDTRANYG